MSSADMWRPWLPARISRILTRGSVTLSPALRRSLVSTGRLHRRGPRRFRYDAGHYRAGPPAMRPDRLLPLIAAALAFAALPGCIYRMDIQQGNLLDRDQVDQVEVGMTR